MLEGELKAMNTKDVTCALLEANYFWHLWLSVLFHSLPIDTNATLLSGIVCTRYPLSGVALKWACGICVLIMDSGKSASIDTGQLEALPE